MPNSRCVITGASRGIGLATAVGLARRGFRLTLVSRDSASGTLAAGTVRRSSPDADIDWVSGDLSAQREVRRLAAEIRDRYESIDVLIHNAAVITPQRTVTEDGIETQFAVNHLAPFLLTQLLLDRLRAGAPSRIVVVASQVERGGRIAFDDLMGEGQYDSLRAYSQSKLANVLFTYALATRLRGTGVTVNCLHPGVVRTRLLNIIGEVEAARDKPASGLGGGLRRGVQALRSGLRSLLPIPPKPDWALTPEAGAATTIMVASDPELVEISGCYFREGSQAETSVQSMDLALQERLWEVSEGLTGLGSEIG